MPRGQSQQRQDTLIRQLQAQIAAAALGPVGCWQGSDTWVPSTDRVMPLDSENVNTGYEISETAGPDGTGLAVEIPTDGWYLAQASALADWSGVAADIGAPSLKIVDDFGELWGESAVPGGPGLRFPLVVAAMGPLEAGNHVIVRAKVWNDEPGDYENFEFQYPRLHLARLGDVGTEWSNGGFFVP